METIIAWIVSMVVLIGGGTGIFFVAKKKGAKEAVKQVEEERKDVIEAMEKADIDGPRTKSDTTNRLRDGTF